MSDASETIWAPWRMSYILGDKPEGCIFCELPKAGATPETLILGIWPNALVMLNRYPYINGHLMVVPRRHVSDLADLPPAEHAEACELVRRSATVLREAMHFHGLNIGMNVGRAAGAGIDQHLHGHLVPRFVGDNTFMPVVGDTRVVNDSLESSWASLAPRFEALDRPVGPETWCE